MKLIYDVIYFILGLDPGQPNDQDVVNLEDIPSTDRERQKLIREQNILKQVLSASIQSLI